MYFSSRLDLLKTKGLADACERSTEFHFPDLGHQLAEIRQTCYRITSEYPNRDMSQQRPIPLSQRSEFCHRLPTCIAILRSLFASVEFDVHFF